MGISTPPVQSTRRKPNSIPLDDDTLSYGRSHSMLTLLSRWLWNGGARWEIRLIRRRCGPWNSLPKRRKEKIDAIIRARKR